MSPARKRTRSSQADKTIEKQSSKRDGDRSESSNRADESSAHENLISGISLIARELGVEDERVVALFDSFVSFLYYEKVLDEENVDFDGLRALFDDLITSLISESDSDRPIFKSSADQSESHAEQATQGNNGAEDQDPLYYKAMEAKLATLEAKLEHVESGVAELKGDVKSGNESVRRAIESVRQDVGSKVDGLRNEIEPKFESLRGRIWHNFLWTIAGFGSVLAALAAAFGFIGVPG